MGPESLPALAQIAGKVGGVLESIYGDLAALGVRQVGKALETVLQTGNIVLLPLRMLNKKVEEFERRNFKEIADRMARIEDDDILDVRPEIGVSIIESLSKTTDDTLRTLFIELLAKAADKNTVDLAHPSFVKVIECLTPDEALILKEWVGKGALPFAIVQRIGENDTVTKVYEPVMEYPDDLVAPDMLPAYISNMVGLGLISYHTDRWIGRTGAYDVIIGGVSPLHRYPADSNRARSGA